MDRTEKYIKMCEQISLNNTYEEFDLHDNGDNGDDWYYSPKRKIAFPCGEFWCREEKFPNDTFPLFRQDQLQEISGMNWVDFDSAIKQFGDSLFHNKYSNKKYKGSHLERSEEISKMVTREQLAIRVVMWEKYRKVWNDEKEEWVEVFMKSIGNKEVL